MRCFALTLTPAATTNSSPFLLILLATIGSASITVCGMKKPAGSPREVAATVEVPMTDLQRERDERKRQLDAVCQLPLSERREALEILARVYRQKTVASIAAREELKSDPKALAFEEMVAAFERERAELQRHVGSETIKRPN